MLLPTELAAPILVGVSGGPDSLALLHLLWRWLASEGRGGALHAVVVDHALRSESAAEAARVAALCDAWGITVAVRVVRAGAIAGGREGLEDAARQERYRLFAVESARIGARTVALGHQADDQAETLLMHLLRGAGLAGLTGMPVVRRSGDLLDRYATIRDTAGRFFRPAIWRPLRGCGRPAIEAYCSAWGLAPSYDSTNDDLTLRRNSVRHRLLPLIEEIFPGSTGLLAREAALLADDEAVLRWATDDAWERCTEVADALVLFDRAALRAEPPALQRRLLRRAWLTVRGVESALGLSAAPIEAAREAVNASRSGGRWLLPDGIVVLVEHERVAVGADTTIEATLRQRLGLPLAEPGWSTAIEMGETIELPESWTLLPALAAFGEAPGPACCPLPSIAPGDPSLLLRTWQVGDLLVLPGNRGTQKLQDWFVDHHIPRYGRRHLILMAAGARIYWVVGLAAFVTAGAEPWPMLRLLYNGADDSPTA
ncbi:MAG TPA: tRNA lysidine(34) synthetase TilS [Thermomicrobiales bacterium]|jgi:tRNA(Ile)-lysidine synthase